MTLRGAVVGEHSGIHRYTIGQRRGIGIASERPLYVLGIDAGKNRVIVGAQDELFSSEFIAAGVNWVAFDEPKSAVEARVRIRYRHTEAAATIIPLPDGRARVVFAEPQRAITPGQARYSIDGDEVVGGGWIVKERSSAAVPVGSEARFETAHKTGNPKPTNSEPSFQNLFLSSAYKN